jgi:SAM-dependent methyltransferase
MASPLSLHSTWDLVADAYVDDVAPSFAAFADAALDAVDVVRGADVVDVACGPGTVAVRAALRGARVRALDFSAAMAEHCRAAARAAGVDVDVVVGDGQALPYASASADAAISLFGLMFFPDRGAGMRELARVLRPGGRAAITSWQPRDHIPILHDATTCFVRAIGATAPPPTPLPLGSADDVAAAFAAAGFVDVDVRAVSVLWPFATVTAMLEQMARSTAPIRLARQAMGEAAFADVFARWNVAMLERHGTTRGIEMPLEAWLGSGRTPGA